MHSSPLPRVAGIRRGVGGEVTPYRQTHARSAVHDRNPSAQTQETRVPDSPNTPPHAPAPPHLVDARTPAGTPIPPEHTDLSPPPSLRARQTPAPPSAQTYR